MDKNEIPRWDVETLDERTSSEGRWVLFTDHEVEVGRLRAEVEGLRMTLEIIAVGDSSTPHIDAAQALIRSGYWTDEIDAAMGTKA